MSSEIDEFHQSLVAAVQAELERHASAVVAEVDRVREEGRSERAELKAEFQQQVAALSEAIDQVRSHVDVQAETARRTLEERLVESESRQTRRLDDVTAGVEGLVVETARPLLAEVNDEQVALAHKVDGLDQNLRKFDEQAARMVTYFNDVSQQMEQKQEELSETLKTDIGGQLESVRALVEENDSAVRRFQNEIGQSTSQKINDAEDRFNNRLLAAESRMKEDAGQKIADIDAHVGRVSTGLDETMNVLNDRIAALDDRFVETGRRIDEVAASVEGVDQEALDELKEKMSSAVGEAMLVRIEMERMEKDVNERTDGLTVRMTEIETELQDATMDVSTAVQLDRLEEIERQLIELDPDKFVVKDGASGADEKSDVDGGSSSESGSDTHDPIDAIRESS